MCAANIRCHIFRASDYDPDFVRGAFDPSVGPAPMGTRGRCKAGGGASGKTSKKRRVTRRGSDGDTDEERTQTEEFETTGEESEAGAGDEAAAVVQRLTGRKRASSPSGSRGVRKAPARKASAPLTPDRPHGKGIATTASAADSAEEEDAAEVGDADNVSGTAGPEGEDEDMVAEDAEEDDGFSYFVEKVMNYKCTRGKHSFLIRWMHYGPEFDTWEPIDCLDQGPAEYEWAVPMPACFRKDGSTSKQGSKGKR